MTFLRFIEISRTLLRSCLNPNKDSAARRAGQLDPDAHPFDSTGQINDRLKRFGSRSGTCPLLQVAAGLKIVVDHVDSEDMSRVGEVKVTRSTFACQRDVRDRRRGTGVGVEAEGEFEKIGQAVMGRTVACAVGKN